MLLIAALFHDFDHSGIAGHDDQNIARALRGLDKHILAQDRSGIGYLYGLIEATEFPHRMPSNELGLGARILRDADMAQAFNPAWIQQVVFGLSAEWRKPAVEVLRGQIGFLKNLKFTTQWAQANFPQRIVDAKTQETLELLALVDFDL